MKDNKLIVGGVGFEWLPNAKGLPLHVKPEKVFAGEEMPERHITREDAEILQAWLTEKLAHLEAQDALQRFQGRMNRGCAGYECAEP